MTSRELFDEAIKVVLEHEGEEVTDDPDDPGGITKFGISQHWNGDIDVRKLTREQAIEYYWSHYWEGQGYEGLPEEIAIKTFDLAVNLGKVRAIECLQRALWSCEIAVHLDGALGPETCAATTQAEPKAVLAALRSEAASEYSLLLDEDENKQKFGTGWLKRAYS